MAKQLLETLTAVVALLTAVVVLVTALVSANLIELPRVGDGKPNASYATQTTPQP